MKELEAKDRLLEIQKPMFEDAIKIEKHKISLYEAPTGFGKSIEVTTIAEDLALKGKKIIIATPTNQLSTELLELLKNKNKNISVPYSKDLKVDIVVGKANYYDINNFNENVYSYIDREQVANYIKSTQTNEDRLIESLFDNIDIEEPNKIIVSEIICCKETKEFMSDFKDLDISVTNFAYLLLNVFYIKDFDISEYIVIADEVHQIVEVAENLLTNSFSLFRYKNLTSAIETELKSTNTKENKRLLDLMQQQSNILNDLLDTYSNENNAGGYYHTSKNTHSSNIITDLKSKMGNISNKKQGKTFHNELNGLLLKEVKKIKNPEIDKLYKIYNSEKSEMLDTLNTPDDVTVYLSPSKGYPTLNSAKGDIRGYLLTYLWDKVESFIGVSATLKAEEKDNSAFHRLGITRGTFDNWLDNIKLIEKFVLINQRMPTLDDKDTPKLASFIERQKKGYMEGWLELEKENILIDKFGREFFNDTPRGEKIDRPKRIEHIKRGVEEQPLIFKNTQARTFLPSESIIKPVLQKGENETEWFDMIANTVANNYEGKNSLIICGSFYEVEKIARNLKLLLPKENIIYAHRNKPTAQAIALFKKQGGILIGTRNYGTGVNLPQKELEKLFIVKLPFPIFTTKKWLDIKAQDKRNNTSFYNTIYNTEMIYAFRQWIGRLIRSKNDSGDLYILDSRINEAKYINKLKYWIERMSLIQDNRIVFDAQSNSTISKKSEIIIDIIDNLECDSDIKEYLLNRVDDIIKNGFPVTDIEKDSQEFRKRFRKIRKENEDIFNI